MTVIRWTLHGPDDGACERQWGRVNRVICSPEGLDDPAAAVKALAEKWFTPRNWRAWIGDDDDVVVHIRVIEPPELSGIYRVGIELVTSAAVTRTGDA